MRIKILYVITIFVTSGIWSCGSSKKVQKRSEVVRIGANTKSSDSSSVVRNFLTTETDSINEELQITIIEYDTAKPIDLATGKPPIKKEIKANKSKIDNKMIKHELTEKQVEKAEFYKQVEIQDSILVEKVKEKQESTIIKQVSYVLWSVFAIILAIILFVVIRRIK